MLYKKTFIVQYRLNKDSDWVSYKEFNSQKEAINFMELMIKNENRFFGFQSGYRIITKNNEHWE
jgi:hypothetical protein